MMRTGELSGTLVQVDIGLLADEVGVSATDTLNLGQGVDNFLLAVNVGVEQTQDELEVRLLGRGIAGQYTPLKSRCGQSCRLMGIVTFSPDTRDMVGNRG